MIIYDKKSFEMLPSFLAIRPLAYYHFKVHSPFILGFLALPIFNLERFYNRIRLV